MPTAPPSSDPFDQLLRQVARTPAEEHGGPSQVAPGQLVGRFEIVCQIGRGGFGVVYRALDTELGRHVAVKLVRPERLDATGLLQLFRSEAEAAARLNHPNIITIHDVGGHDGAPYLVLELLEGETLADRIDRVRLRSDEAVEVLVQVARGLQHAHAAGVVHRDLKPSNVFIRQDGQIKIVDFGLASLTTRTSSIGGTPSYMAPEQWRGETTDERTDLFACGVMLFEMLVGRLPFEASRRGLADPEEIRRALATVAPALAATTARLLAAAPTARHSDAEALLHDLVGSTQDVGSTAAPYRYLEQFTEADAAWFFGRERGAVRLQNMLAARPVVALLGPPGAGKSSLVHAGLLPRLRRAEPWTVLTMRPGPDPLARLHERLCEACGDEALALVPDVDALASAPGRAGQLLRQHARASRAPVLLFVDQLEELITLTEPKARRLFTRALLAIAQDAGGPARVVVTLRDDFLVRLSHDAQLRDALMHNLVLVQPPDEDELAETLERPAARAGFAFEAGLVQEMVAAVSDETAPLPVLQLAASRLWERRDVDRKLMTRAGLEDAGGVAGILAAHAEDVLDRLADPVQRRIARSLLCDLVTEDGTRRRVRREQLLKQFGDPALTTVVLEGLIAGRLLTCSRREQGEWVEIVHESLIARWTQLSDWVAADRADRPFRERLRAAASAWRAGGARRGLLWSGEELADALRWRDRHEGMLGHDEGTFLARSEARLRRRRRSRHGLVLAAALAVLVAAAILVVMVREYREAARVAHIREVVSAAATAEDPLIGALLLAELEAGHEPPGGVAAAIAVGTRPIPSAEHHHGTAVNAGAWSPDDRRVVTAAGAEDPSIHIWSADGTGPHVTLRGHTGMVLFVAFSPDGERIVTASDDRTAKIWRVDGDGEPVVLPHGAPVQMAAFSADGAAIVTYAPAEHVARLWRSDGSGTPVVFRHEAPVMWAELSPDGSRMLTSGEDGLRLWTSAGVALAHVPGETGDAHFSPDGGRILSGSPGAVRVWRADLSESVVLPGARGPAVFSADGARVLCATERGTAVMRADGSGAAIEHAGRPHQGMTPYSFAPDGSRVLIATEAEVRVAPEDASGAQVILPSIGRGAYAYFSHDGTRILTIGDTARVWPAGDPPAARSFRDPSGVLTSALVSPDGQHLLTTTETGPARLWPLDGGAPNLLAPPGEVNLAAVFSRNGRHIAGVGADGRVRIWPVGGGAPRVLPVPRAGERAAPVALDFSPDGAWLAAGMGGVARDWNVTVIRTDGSGEVARVAVSGVPRTVAFSPDGSRLLAGVRLSDSLLWRTVDLAAEPIRLRGQPSGSLQAAFHPRGALIATAAEAALQIWAVDDGKELGALQQAGGGAVSFSPDGSRLATGRADGSAHISPLRGDADPIVLRGHQGQVLGLSFTPDGRRVATFAEGDQTAWLWTVNWDGLHAALRAATTACLSPAQRTRHLGESDQTARARAARCERRHGRND